MRPDRARCGSSEDFLFFSGSFAVRFGPPCHTASALLSITAYHCVFSTKERRPLIAPDVQHRLWSFIGGVARDRGCKSLIVGGMPDHVHILLSLPSTIAVADAMREIKHGSSLWMHEMIQSPHFAWQEGYGAFSIGWKQVDATVAYIEQQAEHHKKRDFQAEFLAILKMHQIECDSRYIFG